MRTYLICDMESDEFVGYFSIKAGMASENERDIIVNEETGEMTHSFDTVPGIEIANFAVNVAYRVAHRGIEGLGILIFRDFIQKIVQQIGEVLGVKLLYIYALPYDSLINRYKRFYHFERLEDRSEEELHKRMKPLYDMDCIFMYQNLN